MGQKRSYKQYPQECKEEAVALVRDQDYSVAETSKSLGVATNLLYRWKGQQEQLSTNQGLTEGERTKLQRLRKENNDLSPAKYENLVN